METREITLAANISWVVTVDEAESIEEATKEAISCSQGFFTNLLEDISCGDGDMVCEISNVDYDEIEKI